MNEYDLYILECFKNNKSISGIKIKKYSLDFEREYSDAELYAISKNVIVPKCKQCSNNVKLRKPRKFTTFCGEECKIKYMSQNNKEVNANRNKQKSVIYRESIDCDLQAAIKYYKNSNETIQNIAIIHNITPNILRKELSKLGLTNAKNSRTSFKNNLKIKFEPINQKLSNVEFIEKCIDGKLILDDISKEMGCSKNYIAKYLRDNEMPYPKTNCYSSLEREIEIFLIDNNVEYILGDRKILSGKELDFYIPKLKLAIEVNGSYFHQTANRFKTKTYHLDKTKLCEMQGIRLIHISDYDLFYKKDHIFNILKSALKLDNKIYARKCQILEIESNIFNNFCNKNHIQHSVNSSVRYALIYNGEIVCVMGFAKPRFNKNYDYEITRYCSINGTTVIGGASKLFKNFINKYNNCKIISYCQRKYFNGKMYSAIGMDMIRETPPNYVWVSQDLKDIKTRYMTQKHKLKTLLSEDEEMTNKGYFKIYDCGQKVFSFNSMMDKEE